MRAELKEKNSRFGLNLELRRGAGGCIHLLGETGKTKNSPQEKGILDKIFSPSPGGQ